MGATTKTKPTMSALVLEAGDSISPKLAPDVPKPSGPSKPKRARKARPAPAEPEAAAAEPLEILSEEGRRAREHGLVLAGPNAASPFFCGALDATGRFTVWKSPRCGYMVYKSGPDGADVPVSDFMDDLGIAVRFARLVDLKGE